MPGSPRFPDFFVVGAPRCGTTAFCKYLARNPQICFSQPKEPHYFTRLDRDPTEAELRRDYLDRFFWHQDDTHRSVGEGSVSYLYLPDVIERIRRINPEARFIALVRNPLQMLPSYHLKMLYLLQEDEPDFGKAWALQSERARGKPDPEALPGSPAADVRRGREARRTGAAALRRGGARAIARRGLRRSDHRPPRPLPARPRVPRGRLRRPDAVRAEIHEPPLSPPLAAAAALRAGGPGREGGRQPAATTRKYKPDGTRRKSWIKRLVAWNRVAASPAPLTPEMRAVVRDALMPDVEHLSKLLDRDLRHWLAV